MKDAPILPTALDADTVADLLKRSAPVTIFDVRTPAEFASAHIPGSYNVPLDLIPEHAHTISSVVGEPVVLVCRSGARARQAEQALGNVELPGLHILDGGLSAWEAAGLPLNSWSTTVEPGAPGAGRCWLAGPRWRPRWTAGLAATRTPGRRCRRRAGLLSDHRHLRYGADYSPNSRTTAAPAATSGRSSTTWHPVGNRRGQPLRAPDFPHH